MLAIEFILAMENTNCVSNKNDSFNPFIYELGLNNGNQPDVASLSLAINNKKTVIFQHLTMSFYNHNSRYRIIKSICQNNKM